MHFKLKVNCTIPIPKLKLNPEIKLLVFFIIKLKNTKSFIFGFSFSSGIGVVQLSIPRVHQNLKVILVKY